MTDKSNVVWQPRESEVRVHQVVGRRTVSDKAQDHQRQHRESPMPRAGQNPKGGERGKRHYDRANLLPLCQAKQIDAELRKLG
jgi:hypothetical protein